MNAAEHNELASLIRALPPLEEALSEDGVEHLMLLPSGRWTARQEGVARRRTTVLDEASLEALAITRDSPISSLNVVVPRETSMPSAPINS